MQIRFSGDFVIDPDFVTRRGVDKSASVQKAAKQDDILNAVRALPDEARLRYAPLPELTYASPSIRYYTYDKDSVVIERRVGQEYEPVTTIEQKEGEPERQIKKGIWPRRQVVRTIPAVPAENAEALIRRAAGVAKTYFDLIMPIQ